jgi:phosphate:Na+ symporter
MNLAEVAREIAEKKVTFSREAQRELNALVAAVEEIVGLAMGAFEEENVKEAYRVEPLEEMIDMLCDELKLHHVNRVQAGECTLDQGFVFNDLLTNLERVADHCSNIAVAMIELEIGAFDTHEYLNSLRDVHTDSFNRYFEHYKDKYDLEKGDFSTGVYDLSRAESSPRSAARAAAPAAVSSSREP